MSFQLGLNGLFTASVENEPPDIGQPTFNVNRNEPTEAEQTVELTAFVGLEPKLVASVRVFSTGRSGWLG